MKKLRARQPDDKQERRAAIMAAGLELWNETTWTDFTMSAVAERAGIVKGTVYLYFATKEQLFLALIEELLTEYFDDVDAALSEGGRWTKSRVVRALADATDGRESLARMLGVLGSILEHNISYDSALVFKRLTLARFTKTGALLAQRLPFVRTHEAVQLIARMSAFVTGLGHMAFPAPVIEQVFAREEALRPLQVNFKAELAATLATMLDGVERRKKR